MKKFLLFVFILGIFTVYALNGNFSGARTNSQKLNLGNVQVQATINNAAKILEKIGYQNFYIEADGDVQTAGLSKAGIATYTSSFNLLTSNQ